MSSRAGRHSQLDVARLTLWYSQPKARVDFGCSLRVLLLRAGCCDAMCVRFDRLRRTLIAHRNALEPTDIEGFFRSESDIQRGTRTAHVMKQLVPTRDSAGSTSP